MGHFERMMVGPSNRLGCAMAATERDGWNYQWLTCLYSCSPKNNTLLYEYTAKPGNFCITGIDGEFQHLCSDKEAVDGCRHTPLFHMVTNDTASKIRGIMRTFFYPYAPYVPVVVPQPVIVVPPPVVVHPYPVFYG